MKDVNYPLREAYMTALSGLTVDSLSVPTYYMVAPYTETGQAFITLNSPSNVDQSTKGSADTETSMQVQIHTWANGTNAGKIADDIAGAVMGIIYPDSQTVLDLSADGLQMISTRLGNDSVQELSGMGARVDVTRILTFVHKIYHL